MKRCSKRTGSPELYALSPLRKASIRGMSSSVVVSLRTDRQTGRLKHMHTHTRMRAHKHTLMHTLTHWHRHTHTQSQCGPQTRPHVHEHSATHMHRHVRTCMHTHTSHMQSVAPGQNLCKLQAQESTFALATQRTPEAPRKTPPLSTPHILQSSIHTGYKHTG